MKSVTVWTQSHRERFFDLGGIQKMYSISCQISRSKNRYMVFQHKLLFNLVKDFSNEPRVWGGVSLSKYSLIEKKFLTQRVSEKSTRYVVKIRALISLYSVSTQISFQPSRGLIQMNWGSRVECYCLSTVWEGKKCWPRWYAKKVFDTLSKFAL